MVLALHAQVLGKALGRVECGVLKNHLAPGGVAGAHKPGGVARGVGQGCEDIANYYLCLIDLRVFMVVWSSWK